MDELNDWAREAKLLLPDGRPVAFVAAPGRAPSALEYEQSIAREGCVATRPENLHDLCNALAWLVFPRTKAALNAAHVAGSVSATPNGRDRRRDAATLLDESGLLVACTDAAVLTAWREGRWRDAFGTRSDVAAPLAALALGHGLLAKLTEPYRAITGRALVVAVNVARLPPDASGRATALDIAAADAIARRDGRLAPEGLLPLPVVALADWDSERLGDRRFDDASVFRRRVLR